MMCTHTLAVIHDILHADHLGSICLGALIASHFYFNIDHVIMYVRAHYYADRPAVSVLRPRKLCRACSCPHRIAALIAHAQTLPVIEYLGAQRSMVLAAGLYVLYIAGMMQAPREYFIIIAFIDFIVPTEVGVVVFSAVTGWAAALLWISQVCTSMQS